MSLPSGPHLHHASRAGCAAAAAGDLVAAALHAAKAGDGALSATAPPARPRQPRGTAGQDAVVADAAAAGHCRFGDLRRVASALCAGTRRHAAQRTAAAGGRRYWAAAADWDKRVAVLNEILDGAKSADSVVSLATTVPHLRPASLEPAIADDVRTRVAALQPQALDPDRARTDRQAAQSVRQCRGPARHLDERRDRRWRGRQLRRRPYDTCQWHGHGRSHPARDVATAAGTCGAGLRRRAHQRHRTACGRWRSARRQGRSPGPAMAAR